MMILFGYLSILFVIAIIVICKSLTSNNLKEQTKSKEPENEKQQNIISTEMKNETTPQVPDTLGLMYDTLTTIGCQPTKNDDGSLSVSYQGENFVMEFGGFYARVWDPGWAKIMVNDPKLPALKEAINVSNFNFGPTIVMTSPDNEGIISIHSRWDILMHPNVTDHAGYVSSVLGSFFGVKDKLRDNFIQISQTAQQPQSRRPVGFSTTPSDEPDE